MVIRLFDDLPAVAVPALNADVVLCPTCRGEGEIALPGTVRQDMFGVWSCDHETCAVCDGTGTVDPEIAIEVDCCFDADGSPTTRLRGERCSPEHELFCDDHLPICRACGAAGLLDADDDPWADDVLVGRSA